MMPKAVDNSVKSYTTDTNSSTNMDVSSLGKDDFLKLLLAEMQNQDPLNPSDNTEFIAQLAQFSSLEQMTSMNENLEKTLESNALIAESISSSMMINYFGKTVMVSSDMFIYEGENPAILQFSLADDITTGTLNIVNNDGVTVRSISLDSMVSGANSVVWDGLTSLGTEARQGKYTYTISAYDFLDNPVDAEQYFTGTVQGLTYRNGKAHFDVNGILVPYENVQRVNDEVPVVASEGL